MANSTSPFLDVLPPELRLRIYEYLLVSPTPLQGTVARRGTRYNLCTKILLTSKQIHLEARSIFFGKNTFRISSLPCSNSNSLEGSGAFEPPLQAIHLPLIRHLEIDPLFYPSTLLTQPGPGGWKPVCPAAERYIMNLTHLLSFVKRSLLSLSFRTDTRPFAGFGDEVFGPLAAAAAADDEEGERLDVRKVLTSFRVIEENVRFGKALRELERVRSVAVSFYFPESDFQFCVEKGELCRRGLLFLASQTIFARSEIKIKALLEGLGEDGLEDEEEEGLAWVAGQRRESVVDEARRVVEAMK